jgi:hypothetical protein
MSQFWRKLRSRFVSVQVRQLWYCPEASASEASGWLGAATKVFRGTRKSRTLVALYLAVMTLGLLMPTAQAQTVINYPSGFASSGQIWLENQATLSGSSIHLVPGTVHNASNAWFKTVENEQAFTTTFPFHIVCTADPSVCGGGFGFMMICAQKLEAIAVATGDTNSAVASAAHTITSPPTVSTPIFSPAAGTYNSAQSLASPIPPRAQPSTTRND